MTEHLGELRSRLIVSLAAFGLASAGVFVAFEPVLGFLLKPLCAIDPERLGPQGCDLVFTKPLEAFLVRLKVTALVGMVVSSPVWLYQLWAFVVPGLSRAERRYAVPFALSSITLFVVGAAFAYTVLPTGLNVLIGLGGDELVPLFKAEDYLNFVGLMLLGFGVSFELPLVLFFLGLAGVITPEQLRRQRRAAIVAIVALAAVVTPTQDPYTLFVMAVPLYALYEVTIALLAMVVRRRAGRQSV